MTPRSHFPTTSIASRVAITAGLALLAALLGLCGAVTALTLARADSDASERLGATAQAVADLAAAFDSLPPGMAWQLSRSGGIVIIDPRTGPADAVFVTHPSAGGSRVLDFEPRAAGLLAALASGANGRLSSPGLVDRECGDCWLVAHRVPNKGWWVLAEVSQRHAMAPTWALLRPFWLLPGAAALALGGLLFVLTRRWVTQPLKQLGAAVEAMAAGDLSHAVDSRRQDELGRLTHSIEAMRSRLAGQMATMRHSVGSLAGSASRLQQKAALAEPSAATVESLREQIQRLSSVVDTFTLGPHAAAIGAPAAPPASMAQAVIRQVREASRPPASAPGDDWAPF